MILQFILSLLWLGVKVFTIKVNERFIAHDSSQQISLLLSSQSGRRPQETSLWSWSCGALALQDALWRWTWGSGILPGWIPYEMCQGWLKVGCWGQPGGVEGTRGGLAPALGQPEDPVSVGPTFWYWRWAWPPRAPALTFPVGRWVPSASASSLRMSPFLPFFFLLPSFLPLFLFSLVVVVVVIKDTGMCFYLFF